MDKLPPEIFLHVLSIGELQLSDFKNLRLAGNRRLSELVTPHAFKCVTLTFTGRSLQKLGELLRIDKKDKQLLRAAEQLYSSNPVGRPEGYDDYEALLCNRIESIMQEDIPSMVKTLRLRAVPKYEVVSKDDFWKFLLPPGRTYGSGLIEEFWEHYGELVNLQRIEDEEHGGGVRYGSYGIAALMLALAGALPNLESVDFGWEAPYEEESWTWKLQEKEEWCGVSVREGWAVLYHGLEHRRKMMLWQSERDRDLFGDEDEENEIQPITRFHLGNVDLIGQYEIFYAEANYLALTENPEAEAPRHHWRWTDFDSLNTPQLDMLTTFSVSLCPWHYSSEHSGMVIFNYGQWVVTEDRPASSDMEEAPLVAPWSVPIRRMRNLKHLNLTTSTPQSYGNTYRFGSMSSQRYSNRVLHPIFNTSVPNYCTSDGVPAPPGGSIDPRFGMVYNDGKMLHEFFEVNYPELGISVLPGLGTVGVEHDRRWVDQWYEYGASMETKVVTSAIMLPTTTHWNRLETLSLSNFTMPVGELKAVLTAHKGHLKNLSLYSMYFISPNFRDCLQWCEVFRIPLNSNWRSADKITYRNALYEIWDLQVHQFDRIDSIISMISHIASLPLLNLISISNCTWGRSEKPDNSTQNMDTFPFAILVEQLLGTDDDRILQLKDAIKDGILTDDELYREYFPERVGGPDDTEAAELLSGVQDKHLRNRETIMQVFSS